MTLFCATLGAKASTSYTIVSGLLCNGDYYLETSTPSPLLGAVPAGNVIQLVAGFGAKFDNDGDCSTLSSDLNAGQLEAIICDESKDHYLVNCDAGFTDFTAVDFVVCVN